MSPHKLVVAACILCLQMATVASAQNAAQNPAGTGRAGRGAGRGGGSPVLSRPSTSSTMSLTDIAKVQEELGLTAEQKQQLDEVRKTTADKQRELYADFQRRAAELNQQADAAGGKMLDEKQRVRLSQLQLQRRGLNALNSPEIAEKLGLTAEQRDKLTTLARQDTGPAGFAFPNANDGAAGRGGTPAGGFDFQATAARARERREKLDAEMIAVLTPEQKAKWDEMIGPKFDFPAAQPGFGDFNASTTQLRSRSRSFTVGQVAANPRTNPIVFRFAVSTGGPAGPFRYQAVVEAVGLSDEQKKQIQTIIGEDAEAAGKIDAAPGTDASEKVAQINKATQEKLDKVLSDEQRKKLNELLNP